MALDDVPPQRRHLLRRLPDRLRRHGRWKLTGAILAALAGYAWIDGAAAPFTAQALLGVLIPGAVIGMLAYVWPPRRIPPPDRLDIAGASYWLITVAALFEWEASAFRDDSLPWHPSLTDLINPMLGPHAIKSAAIFLWMLAGWGLVRR